MKALKATGSHYNDSTVDLFKKKTQGPIFGMKNQFEILIYIFITFKYMAMMLKLPLIVDIWINNHINNIFNHYLILYVENHYYKFGEHFELQLAACTSFSLGPAPQVQNKCLSMTHLQISPTFLVFSSACFLVFSFCSQQ